MPNSWKTALSQTLSRLRKQHSAPRVVLLGIGHELRGDDAAGLRLARGLRAAANETLLVLEAGSVPENVTGLVRRFGPQLVVLADAAQLDEAPGTVRWLDWREAEGVSATTHTLPFTLLARYLIAELDCEVALLGIQPAQTDLDASLSPQVETAVAMLIQELPPLLHKIA